MGPLWHALLQLVVGLIEATPIIAVAWVFYLFLRDPLHERVRPERRPRLDWTDDRGSVELELIATGALFWGLFGLPWLLSRRAKRNDEAAQFQALRRSIERDDRIRGRL